MKRGTYSRIPHRWFQWFLMVIIAAAMTAGACSSSKRQQPPAPDPSFLIGPPGKQARCWDVWAEHNHCIYCRSVELPSTIALTCDFY